MRKLILLLFTVALFSCEKKEMLAFEMKTYQEQACHANLCATVELSYPYYLGDSEVSLYLNTHIEQQLTMMAQTGEAAGAETLSLAVTNFLEDYLQFMREFEDAMQEWTLDIRANQSFQGDDLLSIVFENYSYTGGAHPNFYQQYVNFSKSSRAIIPNSELIVDEEKLMHLAERKFRAYFEIEDGVDLAADDRFFLEDGFVLPLTMGYEDGDFILFYNPYEIGPYVLGATTLRLTKDEMKGIVRIFE